MASTLYQTIFEKGEARGRAGERADTIIRVLTRRVGPLAPAIMARIRSVSTIEALDVWLNEALDAPDAESARRLVEDIGKASLS
jgi:hypothetical protein